LLAVLDPAGKLVLPSDCYMQVRGLAERHLAARGIAVHQLPTVAMEPDALPPEIDLLWLETPSNPGLEVCDVGALASDRPDRPRLVALDNTLATPLGQRGLELGADLVVSSVAKHLSGHADLLLGYVAVRDGALAATLRDWRTQTGAIAGPFETWLAHRSLATLELRLERGCANALALAKLLSARQDVGGLRYPGLRSDPAHALARRQMTRFGTVVAFDLGSKARAETFLERAELIVDATSFGGVRTTAERRGRWGGDAVPPGFVRLSAGCEDRDDLLRDVAQALDASR
jgi:cystathionine gamma-lyase